MPEDQGKKVEDNYTVAEAQGTAIAAFGLADHTLRLLEKKGIFTREEVDGVLVRLLVSFERGEIASDPAVHAARVVLLALAEERGIPLNRVN